MADLTVEVDGSGAYATINAAITAATGNSSDYTGDRIIVGKGTYSENVLITKDGITLIFKEGAKLRGSGVGFGIETINGAWLGAKVIGADISGYAKQIRGQYSGMYYIDCKIEGAIQVERGYICKFKRSLLVNVSMSVGSGGSDYFIRQCEDCTFINMSGNANFITNASNWGSPVWPSVNSFDTYIKNSHYKDSAITIFLDSTTGGQGYILDEIESGRITFDNTQLRFAVRTGSTSTFTYSSYAIVNSFADILALAITVLPAVTFSYPDNFKFLSVSLDSFSFPTTRAAEIKGRTVGANRIATSASVVNNGYDTNTDFTLTSDFLTRNVTTLATLVFNLPNSVNADMVRRVVVHAENPTPANDESYTVQLERTLDGVNAEALQAIQSGLIDTGGGVYDYDYVNQVSTSNQTNKKGRVIINVSGASAGNWRFFGVTLEYYDLEDELPQAARTLVQQLEVTQGNLINGNYSFKMPEALRQYMTDTGKENYTFAELEAEASPNLVGITYADDPDSTNITKFIVQTDTKQVTVFVFKKTV